MATISCEPPELSESTELFHQFRPNGKSRQYFTKTELTVSYPQDISSCGDGILSIPLVAQLAPVAWFTGHELRVQTLDELFAKQLSKIKTGYKQTFERANVNVDLPGQVIIDEVVPCNEDRDGERPALLFTGGVDSVDAFLRRRDEKPALLTVKGNYREESWYGRTRNAERFADYFGTDTYFVEAEDVELFIGGRVKADAGLVGETRRGWFSGVQFPIAYMGILSPLTTVEGLSPFYQSSGATAESIFLEPTADPAIVDLLSWCKTECELVDFNVTRQEKIEQIVEEFTEEWNFHLSSCSKGPQGGECSQCKGCHRNILSLYTAGADPTNFGYRDDSSIHKALYCNFEEGVVTMNPFDAGYLEQMQENLNPDIWSGPDELYHQFESLDIHIDQPTSSLKIQLLNSLHHPIDMLAYDLYKKYN